MNKPPCPVIPYENAEFLAAPEARPLRILSEYLEPLSRFEKLKVNSTILFLGSARLDGADAGAPLHRYYADAERLAYQLARWAIPLGPKGKNFVICTGAGPGIMEAANRGAARAGGKTMGLNISLPQEQQPNRFISPELAFAFHYFFMRKFWLVSRARAVIAFPGGFGTLDELFEILTLLQTGKIPRGDLVVLLYGEEYWRRVLHFDELIRARTISPDDAALFAYASDPAKAFAFLKKKLSKYCRLVGPTKTV